MIFCEIMAGGIGSRMCNPGLPKQFIKVAGIPIIVRTVSAFIRSGKVDRYVICTPADYAEQTRQILIEYGVYSDDVSIVAGGSCRNGSVYNGCKYIKSSFEISNDDIIITHDAVRPFINERIISENIDLARKFGAANTVIGCIDTMMESRDGKLAGTVPDRSTLYRVQTPQSFRFSLLWDIISSAGEQELEKYSDTAGLVMAHGADVALVSGEEYNIKITTPFDLAVAESFCAAYPV